MVAPLAAMGLSIERLGTHGLELTIRGKLERADYKEFARRAERLMDEQGKIALLVELADFDGWTPRGFWEDLKFDLKHYGDVSRLALVGEDSSKEWMATLSSPFTGAEVRFFVDDDIAEARRWVLEGGPVGAAELTPDAAPLH